MTPAWGSLGLVDQVPHPHGCFLLTLLHLALTLTDPWASRSKDQTWR